MKVSVDFDDTLSKPHVQEYIKELMSKGIDVQVTTARYDEDNKHLYPENATNDDMYKITDELGLTNTIKFMNMKPKSDYLKDEDFVWHLDDDYSELNSINKHCKNTKPINVKKSSFKHKCNKLLGL